MTVVLDASAVLAVLLDETGADEVVANLSGSEMSIINACEVLTKTAAQGGDPEGTMDIIVAYGIRVRAFREGHAIRVAQLRPLTMAFGLSFGDRACLARGESSGRTILTGDRRMADAAGQLDIDIRLIR
ncbi:type II toxin-antitoxin system VapC family toxin [Sphingomonas sp. RS2018]